MGRQNSNIQTCEKGYFQYFHECKWKFKKTFLTHGKNSIFNVKLLNILFIPCNLVYHYIINCIFSIKKCQYFFFKTCRLSKNSLVWYIYCNSYEPKYGFKRFDVIGLQNRLTTGKTITITPTVKHLGYLCIN